MKRVFVLSLILVFGMFLYASEVNKTEDNISHPREITREDNETIMNEELRKALELEAKYAKEQKFYDADTYDFKGAEVNEETVKNINTIKPDPLMETNDFYEMPN